MLRRISLLALIFLYPLFIYAQFILAGAHGGQEYFYDNVPDKSIHVTWANNSNEKDSLSIDINGDNINDFTIIALTDGGGQWYSTLYTAIRPLNNNHIAISTYDSCFANCPPDSFLYQNPMANPFSGNDTINQNSTWSDSLTYFSFSKSSASYPNGCGYSCGGYSFPYPTSKYIGLSVLVSGGTIYGWIKINGVQSDSLVIEEYACNLVPSALEEYPEVLFLKVFPNPTSSNLQLSSNKALNGNASYKIYDSFARMVIQEEIGRTNTINIEQLKNGTYYIVIENESKKIASSKFIVRR